MQSDGPEAAAVILVRSARERTLTAFTLDREAVRQLAERVTTYLAWRALRGLFPVMALDGRPRPSGLLLPA
jgi:hypothetical protein